MEKGERPTKHFFNLGKRKNNRKIVKEEDQILETIEKFYKDLYSSKITVYQMNFDEFIEDIEIPKLDNEEKKAKS